MELSEKIRTLLSTWMAGYAQPLVEECAQEAEQLKAENKALQAHHKRLWLAIGQAELGKLDAAYVDELLIEAEKINPMPPELHNTKEPLDD